MWLYLVRHGLAGRREDWEGDDTLRPLTEKGRQKMRAASKGLKLLDPGIGALMTSPLARARQTAEIIGEALELPISEQQALSPGFGLAQLANLLAISTRERGLMLVGHEPDFSQLIGRLIAPRGNARVMMKKGACCALDIPDEIVEIVAQGHARQLAGSATLLWLMTARQLARIAG